MVWDGQERRKTPRLPENNFSPNGAFEGYVYANLENMKERLNNLPCPETFHRLNKLENKVSNMQGKATVWGLVAGFVSGFIAKYIWGK